MRAAERECTRLISPPALYARSPTPKGGVSWHNRPGDPPRVLPDCRRPWAVLNQPSGRARTTNAAASTTSSWPRRPGAMKLGRARSRTDPGGCSLRELSDRLRPRSSGWSARFSIQARRPRALGPKLTVEELAKDPALGFLVLRICGLPNEPPTSSTPRKLPRAGGFVLFRPRSSGTRWVESPGDTVGQMTVLDCDGSASGGEGSEG
jgi:hypothetical protein